MKKQHTVEFLKKWLRENNHTFWNLQNAYYRNTGKFNVPMSYVLHDSTDTWKYYLSV